MPALRQIKLTKRPLISPNKTLRPLTQLDLDLLLTFQSSAMRYLVISKVLNDPSKACNLAKQAFDDAIADIEHIDEDQYKDATTIM